MTDKVTVVKIGGVALNASDTLVQDIVELQKQGRALVIVHGGGNLITEWLKKQGVSTRFVQGERVTDRPTLDVVTAVLAGLANKRMVAVINASGGRAVGISGVDGCLIQTEVKNAELGYVGSIVKVDPAPLHALLGAGYVPVVSPVSFNAADSGEGATHIVNVNGDPAAGEIARALGAERLIYMTDVPGILDKSGHPISSLSRSEAAGLITSGVASGGMIPKIRACLRAEGCTSRIIDGRVPHALRLEMADKVTGTTIK